MPKTWTEKHIRISDQLQEVIADSDQQILLALAMDSFNNAAAWTPIEDRLRCAFLAKGGSPVGVEIGVATIDSEFATIFSVLPGMDILRDVCIPLVRIDEFDGDYVDVDYESKPITQRTLLKARLGEARQMQPMKFDGDD